MDNIELIKKLKEIKVEVTKTGIAFINNKMPIKLDKALEQMKVFAKIENLNIIANYLLKGQKKRKYTFA